MEYPSNINQVIPKPDFQRFSNLPTTCSPQRIRGGDWSVSICLQRRIAFTVQLLAQQERMPYRHKLDTFLFTLVHQLTYYPLD